MAFTMPEGTLEERLKRYLDGFGNRHGLLESEVVGDASSTLITVTDVIPRDGSGSYYERVSAGFESSTPAPVLPQMEDSTDGG